MKKQFYVSIYALVFAFVASVGLVSCKKSEDAPKTVYEKTGIVLSGANEVPPFVSNASGTADVKYDKTSKLLTYTIRWTSIVPMAMHFHGPSLTTATASVKQAITGFPANANSTVTGTVTVPAADEADLLDGKWYINLHTAASPSGELRGQVTF